MTIQWNGYDSGLATGFADYINSVVGPLPSLYSVQQGIRTVAQQNALYAQGRTAPGAIVTDAPGGSSAHNFGLAVDLYPLINGAIDWGVPPAPNAVQAWNDLWNAVRAQGSLITGEDFTLTGGQPDPGHIEFNNWAVYRYIAIPQLSGGSSSVPINPDGTDTYNGLPYSASDAANPYNASPTNPDGTPTYNGAPYDPTDVNNPFNTGSGGAPAVVGGSSGFSLPAILAIVAVAGIGWLWWTHRSRS